MLMLAPCRFLESKSKFSKPVACPEGIVLRMQQNWHLTPITTNDRLPPEGVAPPGGLAKPIPRPLLEKKNSRLTRIKASLPSYAPAEQRVAKLVLADPRAFANLPITELADRAHVSKPKVVWFCRSVGYDGLSDFKLKLAGWQRQ